MALSNDIQQKIEEWTKEPYGADCIREIQDLVNSGNEAELNERFGADLEFGRTCKIQRQSALVCG